MSTARMWLTAARYAALAAGIGIVIQYVITIAIVVVAEITLDTGAQVSVLAPLHLWVALHGVVADVGPWLSGLAWIVIGLWLAHRRVVRREDVGVSTMSELAVFASAAAVLYAAEIVILGVVLDLETRAPLANLSSLAGSNTRLPTGDLSYPQALAVTLPLVAVVTFVLFGRGQLRPRLGDQRVTRFVVASAAGGAIALGIGIAGGALLDAGSTVVDLTDFARGASEGGRPYLYAVVAALGTTAWFGLDNGFVLLVDALAFFRDELYPFVGQGVPAWAYLAVGFAGIGYLIGGAGAARFGRGKTLLSAVLAGTAAGAVTWATAVVLSGVAHPNPSGLSLNSFIYAAVWIPVAIAGGLLYRRGRGAHGADRRPSDARSHDTGRPPA